MPVAKRSREASDAEEEVEPTRKRQHSSQQWEMDSTEMDWTGEHEIYQKGNVLDAEVERFMVEKQFLANRGVNFSDSNYLESKTTGTLIVDSVVTQTFTNDFCESTKLQGTELRRACETDKNETSLERGIRHSCGEIVEAFSCKDLYPTKDMEPLDGDSLLSSDVTDRDVASLDLDLEENHHEPSQTHDEMEKCSRVEDMKISIQYSPNLLNSPESNAVSPAYVNPDSPKPAIQCEAATEYREASLISLQCEENMNKQEDLAFGVQMACGDRSADMDSASLLISNVTQNLQVEVEKKQAIENFTLKETDVTGDTGDDGADAYNKTQEVGECVESQVSTYSQGAHQDSSGNTENNQKNCVQQNGIDFKFELKVVDLKGHVSAVQHQAQNCEGLRNEESQQLSPEGLVADGSRNASQVDISQENSKNVAKPFEACAEGSFKVPVCEVPQASVCEVPQVSVLEVPQAAGPEVAGPGMYHISSSGTQLFGLGGSQISIYKDPYTYTLNTPRILPGLDPSRFSEAKASVAGCPLPSPVQRARSEELQPRKRKRNIMSDEQMAVIENALLTEPYLRRHPDLIMQWTTKLNKMGPEISYQQLKNWLNNRKARLARQRAGELQGGEIRASVYNHDGSAPGSSTCSGSSNDPNRSASEDGTNTKDSGSTSQARKFLPSGCGTPLCKLATEDIDAIMDYDMGGTVCRSTNMTAGNGNVEEQQTYSKHGSENDLVQKASHRSAPVKFVKCEAGQYVSLLDKDGREAAKGTLYQVEGFWQGKRIDEQGICIVRITDLNVEKTTRLPHPSVITGNTFEAAEKVCGQMIVAWDTKRIFLIS
ncbi:hypothetical protein L7F22_037337 [Adiantum nelumboides]|nr:hypothetical protein [Adiantum nelumboides]